MKAIEADKLTQDASFNLETQRLERIRKNIKNCTLIAPTDGIVVYANQTNRWGWSRRRSPKASPFARINRSSICPTLCTCG